MTEPVATSNPSRWQLLSNEWEKSDLPQKIFCQQKGIAYKTFLRRRSQLNKANSTRPKTSLAKLQITPTPQRLDAHGIHISCRNGTQLMLPLSVSKTDLEWFLIKLGVC